MKAAGIDIALVAAFLLSLICGCHKPAEGYRIISAQEAQKEGGSYNFKIALDDSSLVYSTGIASRINTSHLNVAEIEFQIKITSPTGETVIEKLVLPLGAEDGKVRMRRNEGSKRDYLWPWRENIRVTGYECGSWQVCISIADEAVSKAVLGVGLSYKGS